MIEAKEVNQTCLEQDLRHEDPARQVISKSVWKVYFSKNSIPERIYYSEIVSDTLMKGTLKKVGVIKDGLKYRVQYVGSLYASN